MVWMGVMLHRMVGHRGGNVIQMWMTYVLYSSCMMVIEVMVHNCRIVAATDRRQRRRRLMMVHVMLMQMMMRLHGVHRRRGGLMQLLLVLLRANVDFMHANVNDIGAAVVYRCRSAEDGCRL